MSPRPPLFAKQLDYEFLLTGTNSELGRSVERATYAATLADVCWRVARDVATPSMSSGYGGEAAVHALTAMLMRVR